jgi:hypothetical protein
MKEIELTRGLSTIVDDDVFEWASPHSWYADPQGNTYYAARGEQRPDGRHRTIKLHREIMRRDGHDLDQMVVDHINHNGLDNRRSNLRVITNAQNLANRRGPARTGTSGFVGVSRHRGTGRFYAHITVAGTQLHVGTFATAELAAKARDEYVRRNGLNYYTCNFDIAP